MSISQQVTKVDDLGVCRLLNEKIADIGIKVRMVETSQASEDADGKHSGCF
jgi:hypothetical protein